MNFRLQGTTENVTKLIYNQTDAVAFIAAFIYYYLFGHDRMQVVGTLPVPLTGRTPAPHIRALNVISIGTHLVDPTAGGKPVIFTADQTCEFFSFENAPSFLRLIGKEEIATYAEMPELGRTYYFDEMRSLVHLVLTEVAAEHDLTERSPAWIRLNQFFELGPLAAPVVSEKLKHQILTLYPRLQPDDFKDLAELIKNPLSSLSKNRKESIQREAVRDEEIVRQERANSFLIDLGLGPVRAFNSDLIDNPLLTYLVAHAEDDEAGIPAILFKTVRKTIYQGDGTEKTTPMLRVRFIQCAGGSKYDGNTLFTNPVCLVGDSNNVEYLLPPEAVSMFNQSL